MSGVIGERQWVRALVPRLLDAVLAISLPNGRLTVGDGVKQGTEKEPEISLRLRSI